MPSEEEFLAEYNESMSETVDSPDSDNASAKQGAEFPWLMFAAAVVFDLAIFIIALIPIINLFCFIPEIFAAFIFWLWQKTYMPKLDPLFSIGATKVVDIITGGFLPSNMAIVLIAYFKKRTAAKLATQT